MNKIAIVDKGLIVTVRDTMWKKNRIWKKNTFLMKYFCFTHLVEIRALQVNNRIKHVWRY